MANISMYINKVKNMKKTISVLSILMAMACNSCRQSGAKKDGIQETKTNKSTQKMNTQFKSGYAPVNGLNMYYEIHGEGGTPLVLIHGGGSTIETNYSRVLPLFAQHRQVIAMELQVHGRTADREAPSSFEQDADDVAALLDYLKISRADFLGFSNGGNTAMQVAMRRPELVNRAIFLSSFYQREGLPPQFWEFMKKGTFADMPQIYKDAFLKVAPKPEQLMNMFKKDSGRMLGFTDWTDDMIRSVKAPALVMISNEDVVMPEHAVKMSRLMPNARVAIMPGGHGQCIGEATFWKESDSTMVKGVVAMMEQFLDAE